MNRVIHDPSELDALPVGSVVMTADGRPLHKSTLWGDIPAWFEGAQRWAMTAVSILDVAGPLTVLHDPSAPATAPVVPVVSDAAVEAATAAVRRERAFEAAAAFGVPGDAVPQCAEMIAYAALSAALPFLGAAPSAPACAGCGLAQREHQPGYAASRCAYTPSAEQCGAWGGCSLPHGHNLGRADIPMNHRVPSATREDVAESISSTRVTGREGAATAADALLARFTITPRTDR